MRPEDLQSFASRILRQELVPSTGCTEPAAVALASAAAAAEAGGAPRQVRIAVDLGTYKNTLAVGLPATDGKGPALAAAAGALLANPGAGLEILGEADHATWEKAASLVADGAVMVNSRDWREVRIEATVTGHREARARIRGRHDRIETGARTRAGGKRREAPRDHPSDAEIAAALAGPADLLACVDAVDSEGLALVESGIAINRRLAEHAMNRAGSPGPPFNALAMHAEDAHAAAKAWVGAAIDARMRGVPLRVMTSAGSGNSGITVSLGTWAAARALGAGEDDRLHRAVALAHLVNLAVKVRIGRVGPLCGGAIASAMGVGCGLAWWLGGREAAVDRVIRHLANSTAGTVCDGAKPACALKVAGGLGVAIDAARLATGPEGWDVDRSGLGGNSGAQALERLGRLADTAFRHVDRGLVALLSD